MAELKKSDPKQYAYIRDFEEWFADQSAVAFLSNKKRSEMSIVQAFFADIVKKLQQIMGKRQVEKYIENMAAGDYGTKKKV
jgi:hypothetical protein